MDDFLFNDLKSKVCQICDEFGYDYYFGDDCSYFLIYGRTFDSDRLILTSHLLSSIISVNLGKFNGVHIDCKGRLVATFIIG